MRRNFSYIGVNPLALIDFDPGARDQKKIFDKVSMAIAMVIDTVGRSDYVHRMIWLFSFPTSPRANF